MAWDTPTITRQRGRVHEHTYVTCVGTLSGVTDITLSLDNMPLAVIGGTVQARSDDNTNTDKTTITIRHGNATLGVFGEQHTYQQQITIASDPDYWPIQSLFENFSASDANSSPVNYMDGIMVFPTNEWLLKAVSDQADETTETVTVYISMLSHILDLGDRTA